MKIKNHGPIKSLHKAGTWVSDGGKAKSVLTLLLIGISFILPAEVLHQVTFKYGTGGWSTPAYWNGTFKREKDCAVFESTSRNGREFARAYASQKQIVFFPGYRLRMVIDAKGEGKLLGGFLIYGFKKGDPSYQPCAASELGPEYQKHVYTIELKTLPRMVLPYMEIQGQGKAEIRSILTENITEKGVSIQSESPMEIVRLNGQAAPAKFRTSLKNSLIDIAWIQGNRATLQKRKSDASGCLSVQLESGSEGDAELTASAKGVSATHFIDFMPDDEYNRFDAAARKVKANSPMHILIIGDSLSDFYRGRNYVDKLNFWLNKYNPGKFTFRNAGVAGDFLLRVKQRLLAMEGGPKTFRQEMYNDLFQKKYDLVLIFLGQNDTYVTRAGNFENPRTPLKQQKPLMVWLVNYLKKKTQAPVVLVSPSPSDEHKFQEMVRKNKGNIGIFGSRKQIDAFDAMNRQVCNEMLLNYIDILNPIRENPDQAKLYINDGVHLSCKGARFIAFEMLKWFADFKTQK